MYTWSVCVCMYTWGLTVSDIQCIGVCGPSVRWHGTNKHPSTFSISACSIYYSSPTRGQAWEILHWFKWAFRPTWCDTWKLQDSQTCYHLGHDDQKTVRHYKEKSCRLFRLPNLTQSESASPKVATTLSVCVQYIVVTCCLSSKLMTKSKQCKVTKRRPEVWLLIHWSIDCWYGSWPINQLLMRNRQPIRTLRYQPTVDVIQLLTTDSLWVIVEKIWKLTNVVRVRLSDSVLTLTETIHFPG